MVSQILDVGSIQDDMASSGVVIQQCLFLIRRDILNCEGCYLAKVCRQVRREGMASASELG